MSAPAALGFDESVEEGNRQSCGGKAREQAAWRDFTCERGQPARFQGTVVTDERRLKRIMKRADPAVYPGTYITCVHDHAKALCERARKGRAEGLPDHGDCQSLDCRNVALTSDNISTWRQVIDRIDQRLAARPPLPPRLEATLRTRRDKITAFLIRRDCTPEPT
ncbi:hypothetical protein PUR32_03460 [Streptomyces sp. BE133]|nr:hypothetical protein [Streptomyces sp. BE133]